MDAEWSDDFHHALVTVLTGDRSGYYSDFGSIADLAKSLKSVFVYDGIYAPHRDRIQGRPVEGLPAWRFLGYAQNHDQVGNRAKGERLCHLVNEGRAKIAAALVITAPFVPMLFQGEEWAASSPFQYFTDHEAELGKLVSEGRKKEFAAFGWNPDEIPDPQDEQTFLRSKLNWNEQAQRRACRNACLVQKTHRDPQDLSRPDKRLARRTTRRIQRRRKMARHATTLSRSERKSR